MWIAFVLCSDRDVYLSGSTWRWCTVILTSSTLPTSTLFPHYEPSLRASVCPGKHRRLTDSWRSLLPATASVTQSEWWEVCPCSNGVFMCPCSNGVFMCPCSNGVFMCSCSNGVFMCPCSNGVFMCPCSNDVFMCPCSNGVFMCPCSNGVFVFLQ